MTMWPLDPPTRRRVGISAMLQNQPILAPCDLRRADPEPELDGGDRSDLTSGLRKGSQVWTGRRGPRNGSMRLTAFNSTCGPETTAADGHPQPASEEEEARLQGGCRTTKQQQSREEGAEVGPSSALVCPHFGGRCLFVYFSILLLSCFCMGMPPRLAFRWRLSPQLVFRVYLFIQSCILLLYSCSESEVIWRGEYMGLRIEDWYLLVASVSEVVIILTGEARWVWRILVFVFHGESVISRITVTELMVLFCELIALWLPCSPPSSSGSSLYGSVREAFLFIYLLIFFGKRLVSDLVCVQQRGAWDSVLHVLYLLVKNTDFLSWQLWLSFNFS